MEPVDLVPGDMVVWANVEEGKKPKPMIYIKREMVSVDNITYEQFTFRSMDGQIGRLTQQGVEQLKVIHRPAAAE